MSTFNPLDHAGRYGPVWTGINFSFLAVGYWLAPKVVKQNEKSEKNSDLHETADLLSAVPIFPVIAYLAGRGCLRHQTDLQDRWFSTSGWTWSLLYCYVIRNVVSFPAVFMGHATLSHKLMMSLHHVISIISYGGGLLTGRLHYWACLDALCETSTIFLNNLHIFRRLELTETWGTAYVANGACLWSTFLVFRMGLFPYWLYHFFHDLAVMPAESRARISSFEKTFYPATTVVLLGMSTMWFGSITKGMLKALGVTKNTKKQD